MMKKVIKNVMEVLPVALREKLKKNTASKDSKHWQEVHRVKQLAIQSYSKEHDISTLVETGTYLGDMVWAQLDQFDRIYSVELGHELWQNAVKRFKDYKHVTILQGDSGMVLNQIITQLSDRAVFFLDGHYSAGITAKGELECPIFDELKAIFRSSLNHILLIDDARLFNGTGDYPTLEELSKFVLSNRPESKIEVKDDIIRITLK